MDLREDSTGLTFEPCRDMGSGLQEGALSPWDQITPPRDGKTERRKTSDCSRFRGGVGGRVSVVIPAGPMKYWRVVAVGERTEGRLGGCIEEPLRAAGSSGAGWGTQGGLRFATPPPRSSRCPAGVGPTATGDEKRCASQGRGDLAANGKGRGLTAQAPLTPGTFEPSSLASLRAFGTQELPPGAETVPYCRGSPDIQACEPASPSCSGPGRPTGSPHPRQERP